MSTSRDDKRTNIPSLKVDGGSYSGKATHRKSLLSQILKSLNDLEIHPGHER